MSTAEQRIGEVFREAREKRGASLSQAAAATRIKIQHIESMERDDFSQIAAAMYAKGFIKIYAEYLGLDPDPLVKLYEAEHARPVQQTLLDEPSGSTPGDNPAAESSQRDWLDLQQGGDTLRRVGLPVVVIVAVVLLAAWLVRALQAESDWNGIRMERDPDVPARIGDPPDVYLDLSGSGGGGP